jgi:uncharacterized membrane protein
MNEAYLIWKTAHVVSAAILFGTGFGIAFFAWFGYRRALGLNDIGSLRTVLRLTVICDLVFTAPAVIFQIASGLMLVYLDGWSYTSEWVLAVLGLFTFTGLLWLPVVGLQIALSREAERAVTVAALGKRFHRRFTIWFVLGIPAFLSVLCLYYLMITKALPVN